MMYTKERKDRMIMPFLELLIASEKEIVNLDESTTKHNSEALDLVGPHMDQ